MGPFHFSVELRLPTTMFAKNCLLKMLRHRFGKYLLLLYCLIDLIFQLRVVKQPIGDSAMHLAARKKDHHLVKTMIEAGGQIDTQNNEGQTVLHVACMMGDEETVRVLFMARANAGIPDREDRVPIHLAAERGYSKYYEQ